MSDQNSMAWYRKYRPSSMEDYMGDNIKHIVEARFTVETNRPNVILVYGNRGCGKTTFARIISKYYMCLSPVDGKPCEKCDACRSINDTLINGEAGAECDFVTEVDATTANGKEAIQSIIEDAIVPPYGVKYKILILDECHMITKQAQNSLLKVIEDIPAHLIVIFCTTDVDDVLTTIKSRCQLKLEVKKKSVDELASRLLYICKQEGCTTSMEALKIIAKKADRVPREAINQLEDVAKSYGNQITVENVRSSTGDIAADVYMDYFNAANTGLEEILLFNKKLKSLDIGAKAFVSSITRFALDCLYIKHAIALEEYPIEYVEQVKELFKTYKSSEFDALLQVLEYAGKIIGEDDAKNELIITTTAMRIGKIGLIASGLANEKIAAEKENTKSIKEYKDVAQAERDAEIEKVPTYSVTKEKLAGLIKGMTDVKGGNNMNLSVCQPSLISDTEKSGESKFMDQESLEKMMSE